MVDSKYVEEIVQNVEGVTRREFIKRAITAGLLAGATAIGIDRALATYTPPHVEVKRELTSLSIKLPFIVVYKNSDSDIVAVDTDCKVLVRSGDAHYVIQDAVNALADGRVSTRGGTIVFSPDVFVLSKPLEIKHRQSIRLKGTLIGHWGHGESCGTRLEFYLETRQKVAIDARVYREPGLPYDNDLYIEDMAIPICGPGGADYGIVVHNYKLIMKNVDVWSGTEAKIAIVIGNRNGPHHIENVTTSGGWQIGLAIWGDHVSIINFVSSYHRWAILHGYNVYVTNAIGGGTHLAVDDLGLEDWNGSPYNTFISNVHSYTPRYSEFNDTCAMAFQGTGRNVIENLHIEGLHHYGIIVLGGQGTLTRLSGVDDITVKYRTFAGSTTVNYDSPRVVGLRILDSVVLGVDAPLDVTTGTDVGARAYVKIPAGTTLVAGRNVFSLKSKATYKDYTVWRVTPIDEPPFAMRFYAIDNDRNVTDELLLVVYNDSGTDQTLSSNLSLYIELVQ